MPPFFFLLRHIARHTQTTTTVSRAVVGTDTATLMMILLVQLSPVTGCLEGMAECVACVETNNEAEGDSSIDEYGILIDGAKGILCGILCDILIDGAKGILCGILCDILIDGAKDILDMTIGVEDILCGILVGVDILYGILVGVDILCGILVGVDILYGILVEVDILYDILVDRIKVDT